MDGEVEAAALGGDVAEEEVLKALVLGFVRVRLVGEGGVDVRGFGLGYVVEAEGAEVGDLELFGYGSVGFLLFEERGDDLFEIGVEGWWEGFDVELCEIFFAEGVFEWEELFAVGCGGGEGGVV